MPRKLLIGFALALLTSACSPAAAATDPAASPTPSASGAMVEAARSDLAARLGVGPASIQVGAVEEIDWPDASLGCPQPGTAYAQVVTPGLRITLQSGGQAYTYHTDLANRVVLCPAGGPPAATPLPLEDEPSYYD
jgi:hypothetical protein